LGHVDPAELAHSLFAFLVSGPARSKRLARSVALVEEQASAAGAGAAVTGDSGVGCRGGLLGQLFPPQLFHAGTDCLEVVNCVGA